MGENFAKDVAFAVDVRIFKVQLDEAFEQPCGALRFAERRRGDGGELHLPAADLRLVQMQPLEGGMYVALRGEFLDAVEGGHSFSLGVVDAHEKKSAGRDSGSSGGAVFCGEYARDVRRRDAAAGCVYKTTD